jgi:hypothetical protein
MISEEAKEFFRKKGSEGGRSAWKDKSPEERSRIQEERWKTRRGKK